MKLEHDPAVHLTYCTNVHPGETWEETFSSVRNHVPAVKALLAPDRAFGIGLRLSAAAAASLARPEQLHAFKAFLCSQELYVFTINGFPFGRFHDARVKENVYLPDWRQDKRLHYSNQLADILAELLPAEMEGSISTVPGAFRANVDGPAGVDSMVDNLVQHVAHLVRLSERTGRVIRLALEPEPCCFLETVDETIRFFEEHIFSSAAADTLASLTGCSRSRAEALLRLHLGVCFDVCHAAVEFEDADALDRIAAAGIGVPKIQISSALALENVGPDAAELLRSFDDGTYLHQVVEKNPRGLRRYLDLADAFAASPGAGRRDWRVHFHVPVFLAACGPFGTTQSYLKEILARQRRQSFAAHLEVETYTWNVLPAAYRQDSLVADLAREMEWARQQLIA